MTLVAITGTPGTGKTSIAGELRSRGCTVVDLSQHIRDNGLRGDFDAERDTYEVDLDDLNDSLDMYRTDDVVYMEGHLSHFMDCSMIVVLRCHPDVLAQRLKSRGYSDAKVGENVQSEVLDVILCESTESDIPVYEVDCTGDDIAYCADAIQGIVSGDGEDRIPGSVDWSLEMDKWF
ncbi:MAG: adenylate kinase family protein [Candidatus Methanomethylophilaceae archaeon]|nr:adenylate kinase family protein [Candidatus Methanomethylophilaceae archaeon]